VNDIDVYVSCLFLTLHATAKTCVLVPTTKAYRGSLAPLILNLCTTWMFVVNLTVRPLYHRGKNPVPFEYVALWASEPVWAFWIIEKPRFEHVLPGHRTKRSPRPVTVPKDRPARSPYQKIAPPGHRAKRSPRLVTVPKDRPAWSPYQKIAPSPCDLMITNRISSQKQFAVQCCHNSCALSTHEFPNDTLPSL